MGFWTAGFWTLLRRNPGGLWCVAGILLTSAACSDGSLKVPDDGAQEDGAGDTDQVGDVTGGGVREGGCSGCHNGDSGGGVRISRPQMSVELAGDSERGLMVCPVRMLGERVIGRGM